MRKKSISIDYLRKYLKKQGFTINYKKTIDVQNNTGNIFRTLLSSLMIISFFFITPFIINLTKDKMITAYRNHVQPIGMGVDPKRVMAELYGKSTGTSQGLGGSMHIFSKEHRFYGGHGIVGGQIPLGAGLAFADKYFNRDAVTLTFMGDGAMRQGSLHETMNLAMLWKLPVVFCVENNGYAMGTSVERTSNSTEIWKMGLA